MPRFRAHAHSRCRYRGARVGKVEQSKRFHAASAHSSAASHREHALAHPFGPLLAFDARFLRIAGIKRMDSLKTGTDTLFLLLGAAMVLAMHAGFAFLELGTVRKKNQVNALVKILVDFAVSTVAYFFIGYGIAYGIDFFADDGTLASKNGFELVKFFFLLTFAAAIPAIISGGIAERAKFYPQLAATALLVGLAYPLFEGIAWNQKFGFQAWLRAAFSEEFHDFAGSVVVHAVGGWAALPAV